MKLKDQWYAAYIKRFAGRYYQGCKISYRYKNQLFRTILIDLTWYMSLIVKKYSKATFFILMTEILYLIDFRYYTCRNRLIFFCFKFQVFCNYELFKANLIINREMLFFTTVLIKWANEAVVGYYSKSLLRLS